MDCLRIIPGPPRILEKRNKYSQSILSHSKLIRKLLDGSITRTLITDPSLLIGSPGEETCRAYNSKSFGCLFIPDLANHAFLIKCVSAVQSNVENIANYLISSMTDQLDSLSKSKFGIQTDEISLIIWLQKSGMGDLKKYLQNDIRKKLPKFEFKITDENNFLSSFKLGPNKKFSKSICSLLRFCRKKYNNNDLALTLSEKPFRNLSEGQCYLNETAKIIGLFETYFAERHERIDFVPAINQLQETLLYDLTTDGELEKYGQNNAGKYLAEVKQFLDNFVFQLDNQSGVLLKNFSNYHLGNMLSEHSFRYVDQLAYKIDLTIVNSQTLVSAVNQHGNL